MIDCRGLSLELRRTPLVMGVINVTPDSFSDGGRYFRPADACEQALRMVEDGADLVDVGGESTRPGAPPVSPEEELGRILPVVEGLVGRLPVPISVDTRRSGVARSALEAGCHMVNDVSACRDPEMAEVLRIFRAPVIVMHMKGEPETMQLNPTYDNVVKEVWEFLHERVEMLKRSGIENDKIIVDPGIGFGKRFRDNLELLNRIDSFKSLGCPVMIGASRKRFLGELLRAGPDARLSGSLAVAARCYVRGADMIRVHDVKETVGFLKVLDAMEHPTDYSADW